MSFFPSRLGSTSLRDLFAMFPERARFLLEYHQAVMRGPSPLSVAERELIFAYGSGVNACTFCHATHKYTAAHFGVDEALFTQLLDDVDSAPVDAKLKPILRYVKKLTETPSRMTQADADAVFAAGWDERALGDAVAVCALFNFFNRIVEGHGVRGSDAIWARAATMIRETGYESFLKQVVAQRAAAPAGE
jgi:uncharacterized peroxidase-related enzyme